MRKEGSRYLIWVINSFTLLSAVVFFTYLPKKNNSIDKINFCTENFGLKNQPKKEIYILINEEYDDIRNEIHFKTQLLLVPKLVIDYDPNRIRDSAELIFFGKPSDEPGIPTSYRFLNNCEIMIKGERFMFKHYKIQ